jgi:hypothetical protein
VLCDFKGGYGLNKTSNLCVKNSTLPGNTNCKTYTDINNVS